MQYNMRNPSVKRIMTEMKEMSKNTNSQYCASILDEKNIFEWHFTIRGPRDTCFEGGIYHGRILLPAEYPFKPPNIVLLTPNGRFEVGTKICLSISAHHPEYWQPSWSIRTVLIALIGFMPTAGGGAVGALDYSDEERRELARKSVSWVCPQCGSCNRTALPEPTAEESENGAPLEHTEELSRTITNNEHQLPEQVRNEATVVNQHPPSSGVVVGNNVAQLQHPAIRPAHASLANLLNCLIFSLVLALGALLAKKLW